MRTFRRGAAALLALSLLAACSSDDDGDDGAAGTTTTTEAAAPRQPEVEPATLEGPITVGELSPAADPRPLDLESIGYVQEEWFAGGTATRYRAEGELGEDGEWTAAPDAEAPYKTRMLVRRPADPEDFNGTVVLEWYNVSAVEASPEWSYVSPAIVDAGAAYVGVSVQALGVVGGQALIQTGDAQQAAGSGGIKGGNPERYGSLEHPGDAFAFDIWSQVGAAIREGGDVLGGLDPEHVIAAGESQSAFFLTTYHNAIQPLSNVFDGFFIHSRGSSGAQLDGTRIVGEAATPVRLRTDLDVPVLVFETETDVGPRLRFGEARQPDHDLLRIWEAAGTAHADAHLVGKEFGLCPGGINDGPQHYVATAGLAALIEWVEGGDAPPKGEPIETEGTTVLRDELGIALGGIRTPSVDVPNRRLSGEGDPNAPLLCSLFGSSTPFDDAQLAQLYDSQDDYLAKFDAALDEAIEAGFVREADREAYAAEAREVVIPAA
jgi:hypothetical protein